MEIIRRQINLNDYVSRTPALVPYIKTDKQGEGTIYEATNPNGSWGSIMCDYSENGESTASMFNKYYRVKEICRNGLKLKRIERRDGVFYIEQINEHVRNGEFTLVSRSLMENVGKGTYKENDETDGSITAPYIRLVSPEEYEEYQLLGGGLIISSVEDMIGIIDIPSKYTGSKVPERMYMSAIDAYIDWFENNHGYKYGVTTVDGYNRADDADKQEMTGSLPKEVNSSSPKYIKLTTDTSVKYYKKIDAEPDDCCLIEEWNARGGTALWKYLIGKRGLYSKEIAKWKNRLYPTYAYIRIKYNSVDEIPEDIRTSAVTLSKLPEEVDVESPKYIKVNNVYYTLTLVSEQKITVPVVSLPILLTQVYDENGVMTPVGEDHYIGNESKTVYSYEEIPRDSVPKYMIYGPENPDELTNWGIHKFVSAEDWESYEVGPSSPEYTYYNGKYYHLTPELYFDEGPYTTTSKLEELRTRERVYDDDGVVLPFVNLRPSGNTMVGDIPYRVNEVKNLGVSIIDKKSYGDYIESIEKSDTAITFTYYIGGEYDASKGLNINLDRAIADCDSSGGRFEVTVTANKNWALLSVSGDWLVVNMAQNETQGPSRKTVRVSATSNNTLEPRTGSVTFGIVDKGYYEEVTFSVVQSQASTLRVIDFNGTSNYTIYFGSTDGTTGKTSNTGLTNHFNVVCRNSAWYVKSKPSWLRVDPLSGDENISTKLNVTTTPDDGPRKAGEILLVAVSEPRITKILKVVQGEDSEARYIAYPGSTAYTLNYNETKVISICMAVEKNGSRRNFKLNEWAYEIVGGNPSLFRVFRGQGAGSENGYYSITNLNTTTKADTLVINSYLIKEPWVHVFIEVTGKPISEAKKADVYLQTPSNTVDYGKTLTMGVAVVGKNGNTVNMSDWDYVCEPAYNTMNSYVGIYTDKSQHTITVKNLNSTGAEKQFTLYAYYTQDSSCTSSSVTITLKAPEVYGSIQGKLTVDPSYAAFACIQIWPSCSNSNTGSVYATGSNWPGTTFAGSGWSGPQLLKDPNNHYKIKVFNGLYGNVNQFKVTLKKKDGTVGWYGYMRYDVEDWFTITPFEDGNGLYIDAIIEQA